MSHYWQPETEVYASISGNLCYSKTTTFTYKIIKVQVLINIEHFGLGMLRTDNPAFFISGILPDIGLDFLDIGPDITETTGNGRIFGKFESRKFVNRRL
jgi:hypothetical protein